MSGEKVLGRTKARLWPLLLVSTSSQKKKSCREAAGGTCPPAVVPLSLQASKTVPKLWAELGMQEQDSCKAC